MTIKVFLSHSSVDKPFVEKLATDLRTRESIDAWLDKWEIQPGDRIASTIEAGLESASVFLFVMSPQSLDSQWVSYEKDAWLTAQIEEEKQAKLELRPPNRRMIPVLYQEDNTPVLYQDKISKFISAMKYISINEQNYGVKFQELVRGIRGESGKPPLGGEGVSNTSIAYQALSPENALKRKLVFNLLKVLLDSQFKEVVFRYGIDENYLARGEARAKHAAEVIEQARRKEDGSVEKLLVVIYKTVPELNDKLSETFNATTIWQSETLLKRNEQLDRLKKLKPVEFDQVLHLLQTNSQINTGDIPGLYAEPTIRAIQTIKKLEQQSDGLDCLTSALDDPSIKISGEQYEGYEAEARVREIVSDYVQQPIAGRSQEQEQIDQFLESNASGTLLITAPAGYGKSSLLMHWQQTRQEDCFIAFHCFRTASSVLKSVQNAYRHLLRQLYVYYNRRDQLFSSDLRSQLRGLVDDAGSQPGKKLVIVLDGLDEAQDTFEPFLSSPLPQGVYVIASARAEQNDEQEYLKGWTDSACRLPLKQLPRKAISDWVAKIELLTPYAQNHDFIAKLDEVTVGFPLYLRYLLEDLKQVVAKGNDIQAFLTISPTGFAAYVKQQFGQLTKEVKQAKEVQELFVLLSVALGALSTDDIEALTGLGTWDLPNLPWQVTRWFSIRSDFYSFAHPLLAEQFQEALGKKQTDPARMKLIDYCADWQKHKSSYALRYYAEHLQESMQLEPLYELARDEAFSNAQQQGIPDEPELPLKTVKLALQCKAEAEQPDGMAEFLLLHARRKIEIAQESPLDALRAGSLERAWRLAEQSSSEDCILWYLLLTWTLVAEIPSESDPLERAAETLKRLDSMRLLPLSGWKGDYVVYLLGQILPPLPRNYLSLIQGVLVNGKLKDLCKELIKAKQAKALKYAEEIAKQIKYLYAKARTLQEIAIAQVKAGDATAALATAQQIKYSCDKDGALKEIAIAQVNAGDGTAALTTAQQIEDSPSKAKALKEIAIAQVNAGDATAALATAQQIKYSFYKDGALKEIAIAQVNAGDGTAALTTAQQIEDSPSKAKALKEIAIAQVKAGDATAALATAQQIKYSKDGALKEIAIAQVNAGDGTAALTTAQQIEDSPSKAKALKEIAIVQIESGDVIAAQATLSIALNTAHQIPPYADDMIGNITCHNFGLRTHALEEIAIVQGQVGNIAAVIHTIQQIDDLSIGVGGMTIVPSDELRVWLAIVSAQLKPGNATAALATAQQIEKSCYKSKVLKEIAIAQAEVGDVTAAFATAQQIEYLDDKAKALKEIATVQAQLGDAAVAQATLNTALTTAQQIKSSDDKAKALKEIAIVQIESGNVTAALATAQQIEDSNYKSKALKEIAIVQIESGNVTAALATAQQIEDSNYKSKALKEIAIVQIESGNVTAALATAQQIEDSNYKSEALKEIAIVQAQLGDAAAAQATLNTALTTAQQIKSSDDKAKALSGIAIAQAQAGDFAAAQATFNTALFAVQHISEKSQILSSIAMAQAQAGDFAAALTTAQRSDSVNDSIINSLVEVKVVIAQAQAGDFAAALTTAQQFHNSNDKQRALSGIAIAQVKAGDATAALATAQRIKDSIDGSYESEALKEIVIAQVKAGDATTALATARRIKDSCYKAKALKEIAIAQVNAGDADAAQTTLNTALATAQQIKYSKDGASALQEIAIAQVNAGDADAARTTLNTALATAQQIEYSSDKASALQEIAIAQVNAGDATVALATAQQIENSNDKAWTLKEIAIAQAKTKLGEQVALIAEKILTDRNKHLPEIAAALVEMKDKIHFKQLLIPCADYLDAAYAMCGYLAKLYPGQATAIAEVVTEFSMSSSR